MDSIRTLVPQVFLSLSGKDDDLVNRVYRHLPEGLAIFYRKSFANGELLMDAMESSVAHSTVFVFFASKHSLGSPWVQFELSRARLAKLQRPTFRILVFPLSSDVDFSGLPAWMQEYWIPRAGFTPRDIARYIRNIVTSPPIASAAISVPVIGRGEFSDLAIQRMMSALANHGATPNVFIFAGVSGIGRRTFARYFMDRALPALPDLSKGPELSMAQFADLADLYRGAREQVEPHFSPERFKEALVDFNAMAMADQVTEVVRSLGHFGALGQAIFVTMGNGLFQERGDIKEWVGLLINSLALEPAIRLAFMSNRQVSERDALGWPNFIQLSVPPLKEADTKTLMIATSQAFGLKPVAPDVQLIRSIGGHPQIAKAAVRLIAQKGEYLIQRDPASLYSVQDEVLSDNLQVDALTDIQQEVLCMLSWVPQLHGSVLERVIKARHKIVPVHFFREIDSLLLGCLVLVSEENFTISSAIRQMFRRKYGYGPQGLLSEFATCLRQEWNAAVARDEFSSDLFDAFIFMHALEGKSLPRELRDLLLPSTLEAVMRETYARGRDDDDPEALRRVAAWGSALDQMRMDETVREEIEGIVVQAHIRLNEFGAAEAILRTFDQRGYRSVAFLRGFALRRRGKYREAIPFLKEAVASSRSGRASVQELAVCYQKLGMPDALSKLVKEHERVVESSASLLDFKIGALIASGQMRDAEAALRRLRLLPDDEGRSATRQAQIRLQRDHDPTGAIVILTDLVNRRVGNAVTIRRWRAIAAANAGDLRLARTDIDFIRARPGRQETAQRLEVYYALAQHDYTSAKGILEGLRNTPSDDLLRARVLEAESADSSTSLPDRQRLREQALGLRARNQSRSEFDFD